MDESVPYIPLDAELVDIIKRRMAEVIDDEREINALLWHIESAIQLRMSRVLGEREVAKAASRHRLIRELGGISTLLRQRLDSLSNFPTEAQVDIPRDHGASRHT
jgi:hypothetical protein